MIDQAYEKLLLNAFQDLHHCKAKHVNTVPVIETFEGKVVWEGEVEVFSLLDHASTDTGYAWAYEAGDESTVTAVLKIPPVITPKIAVQISILQKNRERRRN